MTTGFRRTVGTPILMNGCASAAWQAVQAARIVSIRCLNAVRILGLDRVHHLRVRRPSGRARRRSCGTAAAARDRASIASPSSLRHVLGVAPVPVDARRSTSRCSDTRPRPSWSRSRGTGARWPAVRASGARRTSHRPCPCRAVHVHVRLGARRFPARAGAKAQQGGDQRRSRGRERVRRSNGVMASSFHRERDVAVDDVAVHRQHPVLDRVEPGRARSSARPTAGADRRSPPRRRARRPGRPPRSTPTRCCRRARAAR